jgi:hypothetical protein
MLLPVENLLVVLVDEVFALLLLLMWLLSAMLCLLSLLHLPKNICLKVVDTFE